MANSYRIRRDFAKLSAAACLLVGGSFAVVALGQTVESVEIAADVVLDDRYPTRKHEFPNGVIGLADLVYATRVGYRPLRLDLYLPSDGGTGDESYPLLIVIHGGGWQSGHTRHFGAFADWPAALAALAKQGFVVASVEYRLSKEAPFPAAFEDVRDAIRWLRAHAAEFDIDESRAAAMGGSAGGQLAALVGTACGDRINPVLPLDEDDESKKESACVQGVVVWYGVFDFAPLTHDMDNGGEVPDVIVRYLDCDSDGCDPSIVGAASAIDWVDPADPPFLLIHGTEDRIVPARQSRAMHSALSKAGVPATLIEIQRVGHSFIGSTSVATTEASRQAWDATVGFLRKMLRDKAPDGR